jgi:hypothetical protein
MRSKPSTLAWIGVHLVYPLLPVILEGGIRLVATNWQFNLETFSAATLAMSSGVLSVFINQSVRGQEAQLPDSNELDARNGTCALFMTLGIMFFVLFGLVVLLHALIQDQKIFQLVPVLHVFQVIVFVGAVIPVVSAVVAQRSFKLRASLI